MKLRLKHKIPLLVVSVIIISSAILGGGTYILAKNQLEEAINGKLGAVLDARQLSITSYLGGMKDDLERNARANPNIASALVTMQDGWSDVEDDAKNILHTSFITENPNPEARHELIRGTEGSYYSITHGQVHRQFLDMYSSGNYADILMVSPEGNVIYSTAKNTDLAMNAPTEAPDGPIAKAHALQANDPKAFYFSGVIPYSHSADGTAAILATTILDDFEDVVGTLIYSLNLDKLDQILLRDKGLGETGELLLTTADGTVLNKTRFSSDQERKLSEDLLGKLAPEGDEVIYAVGMNDLGQEVLAGAQKFSYLGNELLLVNTIGTDEALAPTVEMGTTLLVTGLVLVVVLGGLGLVIILGDINPMVAMTEAMRGLSGGDLETRIPARKRRDELGEMAEALEVFRDTAVQAKRPAKTAGGRKTAG